MLRALGIWAPIGFIAIYATGTILFFPGALLGIAGGALFGPVWGTLWNLLGATLGATIAFLLARRIAGEWVARRLGGRLRRLVDGVTAEGWRFVALMRLVPLVPFNLLNYALGSYAHLAACLRSCIASLHAAGSYRLYLARLRGPLGCVGRYRSALRYGLLGLGVLAMIAFVPRLFRRLRANESLLGSNRTNCSDDLQPVTPLVIVDVRQPDEFTSPPGHLPGAVNVPLAELADRTSGPRQPRAADHRRVQDRSAVRSCCNRVAGRRPEGCCRPSRRHGRMASAGIRSRLMCRRETSPRPPDVGHGLVGILGFVLYAAYLGRELARAERALTSGDCYVQDAAPETEKIGLFVSMDACLMVSD